jgi:PAS domain S-box-containing protein
MANEQILVVEDENLVAMNISERLRRIGYTVPRAVGSGAEAIKHAAEIKPDLVLMDIRLKDGIDGVEAAAHIRKNFDIPVIFLTAFSDTELVERAKLTEPYGYILKPFQAKELHTSIVMALFKHRSDSQARNNNKLLRKTLDRLGEAVITANREGAVTYLNPAASELTGWSDNDALGRRLGEILRVIDVRTRQILQHPALRSINKGGSIEARRQSILLTRDGQHLPVDDYTASLDNDDGSNEGMVVTFHDNSKFLESERMQEEWREVAERAQQLKTELLSNLNKEIREPLHIIQNYTNLVQDMFGQDLDPKYSRYIAHIREAGRSLLDTLNKIVDLSRLHVENFPIRPRELKIQEVVKACLESVRERAERKKLTIKATLNAAEAEVRADEYAIRSAISHILDNAIKYTDAGEISVKARLTDDQRIAIIISDTGIGIESQHLPQIFDEFTRFPDFHKRNEGIGLGLALTKRFVEHSHGSITVRSKPHQGTQITLSFPLLQAQNDDENTGEERESQHSRVALVESMLNSTHLVILLIEQQSSVRRHFGSELGEHMTIYMADSLAKAQSILQVQRVDAVLVDVSLEEQLGRQVINTIKNDNALHTVAIIAFSANSIDRDRHAAFHAGSDYYLSKPFDVQELRTTLRAIAQRRRDAN